MSAVKVRPILFSGPMVRAILAGEKTQTRRVVKPQPVDIDDCGPYTQFAVKNEFMTFMDRKHIACQYGEIGDRLWVRETFGLCVQCGESAWASYRAGGALDISAHYAEVEVWQDRRDVEWYPSIHMPRWASRITLEVTGVRLERLQDISEADARAEGCKGDGWQDWLTMEHDGYPPSQEFEWLWQSINAKRAPWDSNPFVWAISFKRIDQ